ncbi:MAG: putative transposase [Rhodocyclaceae bacterium]|nr:MAG: putative transposase [Rhodocyclaceae bacterium]TND02571.1 MAG: putative transposase [Rhodocyclaceae bacterium]
METGKHEGPGKRLSIAEAFGEIPEPRVAGRSKHDLVEMLVLAACAMVCGVDDFVGIEAWGNERIDWLRRIVKLENGIPSHDTLGRLFGLLDRRAVEQSFRRWVGSVLPGLAVWSVVAIDGKASRRSKMTGKQALHLVSAFATGARLVLGQEACAEKSNELTAIPVLLEALMLKGVIVTIDAMGTHANIAQAIRDKEADYVLAVKDNQPKLAESITSFFEIGQAEGWTNTPHTYVESVEKDHGRLEVRRCWAFTQLDCLANPRQWVDLKMFGVIEAERTINDKTSFERRLYIGSIAPDAAVLANAVRAHWGIENSVHWCLDVALNDDQMRARIKNAGANLAIIRRLVLNLFRLDTSKRKGGIYTRRILAASSDSYRANLLGLEGI